MTLSGTEIPARPAFALVVMAAICICLTGAARGDTVRVSPVYSATGPARVGGPFMLTGPDGGQVRSDDFAGKYMLVYFGYTYCPDVCPGELQKLAEALDQVGDLARRVQPLFITIDPARDSADVLADYVAHFHPSLIGLTGTPEEVRSAARAYRVQYRKGAGETGDDYLIGHTSNVFLMDEAGLYAAHFPYGFTVAEMVAGLRTQIEDR